MQYSSLDFVAGLKRGTDEGSLPEIAQYSPYYLPFNVFTASLPKDQTFIFYLFYLISSKIILVILITSIVSSFVSHYENLPMHYIEIFSALKIKNFIGIKMTFLIFLFKTRIVGAVLTSTHHLCFRAIIGKNIYPPPLPINPIFSIFHCIKVGLRGVYISWTFPGRTVRKLACSVGG